LRPLDRVPTHDIHHIGILPLLDPGLVRLSATSTPDRTPPADFCSTTQPAGTIRELQFLKACYRPRHLVPRREPRGGDPGVSSTAHRRSCPTQDPRCPLSPPTPHRDAGNASRIAASDRGPKLHIPREGFASQHWARHLPPIQTLLVSQKCAARPSPIQGLVGRAPL